MSHRSVRSLALFFSFIVVAVVCFIASFYYHTHTHTYTPATLKGRYTKLRCSLIIRTPPREPFFSPVTVFGFYRRVRATIVITVIAVIVGTARVCARVYLCNCLCGHACHILRSYSSLVLHRRPPPPSSSSSSSSSSWSLAPERCVERCIFTLGDNSPPSRKRGLSCAAHTVAHLLPAVVCGDEPVLLAPPDPPLLPHRRRSCRTAIAALAETYFYSSCAAAFGRL